MATPRSSSSSKRKNQNVLYALIPVVVVLLNFLLRTFGPTIPDVYFNPPEEGSWVRLDVIDVGQGDCLLFTSSMGETMLIDAGPAAAKDDVLYFLQQRNITKLDYVVATHPHEDHIGSMAALIRTFPIGTFFLPDITHTTATFRAMIQALEDAECDVVAAKAGEDIAWQTGTMRFISPQPGFSETDLNNASAVLHIQFGDTSFLLTGDAEDLSEQAMLAAYSDIRAQVLKVGHHGSSTSSTSAFLDAVQPKIALISCGADNSYGHPHRETMAGLARVSAAVYRTDTMGSISVLSDGYGLFIAYENS